MASSDRGTPRADTQFGFQCHPQIAKQSFVKKPAPQRYSMRYFKNVFILRYFIARRQQRTETRCDQVDGIRRAARKYDFPGRCRVP